MVDKISLDRINTAHPKLRNELLTIFSRINGALTGKAVCRFAYVLRTFAEQDALYAQGRTTKGKVVTKAKGGLSYHNYGLAVDIVLLKDTNKDGVFETASWETNVDFDGDGIADWLEVVTIFKSYGWEWGGDWNFKDMPHFQKTFGLKCSDLLALHVNGKVDKEGYVLI